MKPATTTDSISAWWNVSTYSNITVATAQYIVGSTPPMTLAVMLSNPGTSSATYYGFQKAGGSGAALIVKVVGGVSTTLATSPATPYLSSQWIRLIGSCASDGAGGTNLKLAIINLASGTTQGNYLASYGAWSTIPQWFMSANDPSANSPITTAGYVGIKRDNRRDGGNLHRRFRNR